MKNAKINKPKCDILSNFQTMCTRENSHFVNKVYEMVFQVFEKLNFEIKSCQRRKVVRCRESNQENVSEFAKLLLLQ